MSSEGYVLDASALIAIIAKEGGWKTVNKILATGNAVATPIALAETFQVAKRKFGFRSDEVRSALVGLGLGIEDIVDVDADEIAFIQERASIAAAKIGANRQLSMADAACLALGKRLGARVIFSDSFWEIIDLAGIKVLPFR